MGIKLSYPTIDTLADRIIQLQPSKVLIFKIDLSRYFRQVPLCPRDYSLIGMRWRGELYFDKVMPMGLRSAAYMCQRVTNAIKYIHWMRGYWSINYLDDFGGVDIHQRAIDSFHELRTILKEVGAIEGQEKAVPPTTRIEFLGAMVSTIKLTLEITPARAMELMDKLKKWQSRKHATKKQLQSLIGKLNFVTNCVWSGRIFITRLIASLVLFPEQGAAEVPSKIHKDVNWWIKFMNIYNGVSMLWLKDELPPSIILATNACLTAGGGNCGTEYFPFRFPESVLHQTEHISQLELFTVVIALKFWVDQLRGKVIRLFSDNEASVAVVYHGRTRDKFMLKCLHEIAWVSANNDFWVKLQHCQRVQNLVPDLLSRWYISSEARRKFRSISKGVWKRKCISNKLIEFVSPW